MIKSVRIQNFKNILSQTIELDRLTVFVGANGSGKTSVLEAVSYATQAARRGDPKVVFKNDRHLDWLYSRGATDNLAIACTTPIGEFSIVCVPPKGFPQSVETLGSGLWQVKREFRKASSLKDAVAPVSSVVSLRLNNSQLAAASYSEKVPPTIGADGEGLASVLAYMALNDPDSFEEVASFLRQLIPQFVRVRFRKTTIRRRENELIRFGEETVKREVTRPYQGEAILFDFMNSRDVAAHTVSEGTLVLLGLLTVLLGPARPNVVLLDDIEHGLHPLAQKSLLDVLSILMARFPDLQILATAHSPYLLDHLPPDQVRIMCLDDQGHAVCGRLSDHPQFERWKDEMAPGEMWSLFGERWLTEGASAK